MYIIRYTYPRHCPYFPSLYLYSTKANIFSFTENRCNQSTLVAVLVALPVCHIDKCEHYTLVSGPHPAHLWCLLCHTEILQVFGAVSDGFFVYRFTYNVLHIIYVHCTYVHCTYIYVYNFWYNVYKTIFIILKLSVTNMSADNCHVHSFCK